MPTVKHAIKIFFDHDRPDFVLPQQWIADRFRLFADTTLPSILGQTFQDFRIWMICGQRHKDFTAALPWHDRCERIYDHCEAELAKIDADYIAITRIDSDDLMHEDAMREVAETPVFSPDRRRATIFRQTLAWNVPNRFVGPRYRPDTPFVTQFLPRCIYRDHAKFLKVNNVTHGNLGGRDADTVELSADKICVVKHAVNITTVYHGRDVVILTDEQREKLRSKGDILTDDPAEMLRILKPFGITKL